MRSLLMLLLLSLFEGFVAYGNWSQTTLCSVCVSLAMARRWCPTPSFIGDVDPGTVGIRHLPLAGGVLLEETLAHVGLLAAAQRHRREIGIHSANFGDVRLERVEILDVEADVIGARALDLDAFEDGDRPRHDRKRDAAIGQIVAWRLALAVDVLELEHVAIEFGAGFRIGRADGELVDVTVLMPALLRNLGIDLLARVVLLLRQVEDVAVGIMSAIGGEGPRRRTLHDVGVLMLLLHA